MPDEKQDDFSPADTTNTDASDEAQFASDTTERDKGRTDLPWSTEDIADDAEPDSPVPVPVTREGAHLPPLPQDQQPDAEYPMEDTDYLAEIHRMVTDIHALVSQAAPVIQKASDEFQEKGVSGFMSEMMGSLFSFGKGK